MFEFCGRSLSILMYLVPQFLPPTKYFLVVHALIGSDIQFLSYLSRCPINRQTAVNKHRHPYFIANKINVSYIIPLLRNLQNATPAEQEKQHKAILAILDTDAQLRSKKELIERFIANHFPDIPKGGDIGEEFEAYWNEEKQKAVKELSETEGLDLNGLQKIIGDYLFTEKTPMRDDVIEIMNKRPALKERASISERIISKIKAFVETFIDGVD